MRYEEKTQFSFPNFMYMEILNEIRKLVEHEKFVEIEKESLMEIGNVYFLKFFVYVFSYDERTFAQFHTDTVRRFTQNGINVATFCNESFFSLKVEFDKFSKLFIYFYKKF